MSKYIFGPISSRRFGMSLGIDLSPDKKSCNFDCIYCELEKAKKVDFIENLPSVDEVVKSVKDAFKKFEFDVITITANGEPTLYPEMKKLVEELNKIKGDKKLLILSNSTHLSDDLLDIDIVKLSLDAVTQSVFKKIDRSDFKIDDIINSIVEFSKKFHNELILEILVVKGINDKVEEFKKFNSVISKINPDRVDISTIDRPPAYDVEAVDYETLFKLSQEIKNQNIFIATRANLNYKREHFSEDEILSTLSKRPFSENDINTIFDDETKTLFEKLLKDGKIGIRKVGNVKFFTVGE